MTQFIGIVLMVEKCEICFKPRHVSRKLNVWRGWKYHSQTSLGKFSFVFHLKKSNLYYRVILFKTKRKSKKIRYHISFASFIFNK